MSNRRQILVCSLAIIASGSVIGVCISCLYFRPNPTVLQGQTGCWNPLSIHVHQTNSGYTRLTGTPIPCKEKP